MSTGLSKTPHYSQPSGALTICTFLLFITGLVTCSLFVFLCLLAGSAVPSSVLCWHIIARLHFRLLVGCGVPPSVLSCSCEVSFSSAGWLCGSSVCIWLEHTVVARLHFRLLAGCVASFLAHSCDVGLLAGCVVPSSVLCWHIDARLHFRCWLIVWFLHLFVIHFLLLVGCPAPAPPSVYQLMDWIASSVYWLVV
jgi:hypothetical protein